MRTKLRISFQTNRSSVCPSPIPTLIFAQQQPLLASHVVSVVSLATLPCVLMVEIPRAAVHNALSLHPSPRSSPLSSPHADSPMSNGQASPSLYPSALRKGSGSASSASTRVIDNLQTELLNTKGHLERVKSEVRACQRVTGSVSL
jgi:hypothetical protein